MEELIRKIGEDPVLMFAAAVAVVILLFVLLVVIVATMRVRSYRMRFENIRIETVEKSERIEELQKTLNEVNLKNAQYTQELKQFGDVKERLMQKEKEAEQLHEALSQTKSELSQTQAQLEATKERLDALQEEHKALQERFETVTEENNKLRINNARLLTKLESESRMGKRT
jgi:phage-related tail protein